MYLFVYALSDRLGHFSGTLDEINQFLMREARSYSGIAELLNDGELLWDLFKVREDGPIVKAGAHEMFSAPQFMERKHEVF